MILVKTNFIRIICLVFITVCHSTIFGQYTWKLSKEKDGIKVYRSPVANSEYKSIKVECVLAGTYDKLLAVLNQPDHFKDWVYNNKTGYMLNQNSPDDYYYYTETHLPWPATNRDAVEHLTVTRDSLDRSLRITAISDPNYIPEKDGKIRVPFSSIRWYVTAPTANTIKIEYIFEVEPGGSLPPWLVNMFADKGPVESFRKLEEVLKK